MVNVKVKKFKVGLDPSKALSYSYRGKKYDASKLYVVSEGEVDYFRRTGFFFIHEIKPKKIANVKKNVSNPDRVLENPEERGPVIVEKVNLDKSDSLKDKDKEDEIVEDKEDEIVEDDLSEKVNKRSRVIKINKS